MPKRMTDTDIWKNQRWFRKLDPIDKLVFCYIKDQCNHAGIWNIDCTDLMEDLGIKNFVLKKFVTAVNAEFDKFSGQQIEKYRLVVINNNFLWLTGFIQFQYENKEGKVNAETAPVKTALQILKGFDRLDEALVKGYIRLIKGTVRAKDKDIDKDKEKKSIKVSTPKTDKKGGWNTMPTKVELNGLPEQYITSSIELIFRTSHITVEQDAILGLWEVFKTRELTGHNFYANEGKVYGHFLSSMKYINFNNGNSKGGGKLGPSAAREEIRKRGGY